MEPNLPDLYDLRAFCTVVDLGSITAAARALRETKGSVSRRLLRLERTLGISLVRRSPRLVTPTDEGVAYRARAGGILEALEDARHEVEHAGAVPQGKLRVTAPPEIAVELLAPMIARFIERYPDVSVEMLATERTLDFDAHQIDFAFRPGLGLPDSALVGQKVADLGLAWVAAPSYIERRGTPETLEDLANHRLLLFGPQERFFAERLAKRAGGKKAATVLRPAVTATDANFVYRMALEGAGVAGVLRPLVEQDVREGRLVEVLKDAAAEAPTMGLYLLYAPARFLAPKVRAFRDFMREQLATCGKRDAEAQRTRSRPAPRAAAAATSATRRTAR